MPLPFPSLLPAAGPPPASRRVPLGVSVLLHLTAAALLLSFARRPVLEGAQPPSYELVFDDERPATQDAAPNAPESQAALLPPEPALPAPPGPTPTAPPDPDVAAPAPPEPLAPRAPPDVAEPVPPAPPVEAVPQPATPPPAVNLGEATLPPPPFTVPELQPVPEPVRPRAAPPSPPRPRAPAAPAPDRFPAPMDLSFGPAPFRAPAPRRGSVASRAIDLSPGAPKPGVNRGEAYFEVRARNVSADWKAGLQAYWLRHRYYPRQAAEAGEDGTVVIEMVVNRLGRVESVEVKSRSGSAWLDMAAVGTWRNAQLPPLPAEVAGDRLTLEIPIHYLLIR